MSRCSYLSGLQTIVEIFNRRRTLLIFKEDERRLSKSKVRVNDTSTNEGNKFSAKQLILETEKCENYKNLDLGQRAFYIAKEE
jgi:hypothetical protein